MEDFQLRAMETSPYPLNEWFWYVDDSETKCKEGEAQEILDHLNSIEPGVIYCIHKGRPRRRCFTST